MKSTSLFFLPLGLLFGCSANYNSKTQKLDQEDLSAFVELMLGEFETAPDNKDARILDRRVRISSPDLEGDWIYTQLNTGPDKKLYRQRVSNISISDDGNSILQR